MLFIANQFIQFFAIAFSKLTRANSVQISFSILEISLKKCGAHLKLDLLRSRMNAKDFSLKYRQMLYCVTTAFVKNCLLESFAKSAIMYSAATSSTRNV